MSKKRTLVQTLLAIAVTLFAVAGLASATTIGTNISTGGTLSVTGATTLTGAVTAGAALTVDTSTLVVDAVNNRVGIGTTTPGYRLTVAGDIMATGRLYDNSYNAGNWGSVLMSTASGIEWVATSTLGLTSGGGSGTVNAGTAGQLAYYSTSGSAVSGTSTLFISNSGKIGIGTSTPMYKLDVYGDINTNGDLKVNGNTLIDASVILMNGNTVYGFNTGTMVGGGSDNAFFGVNAGRNTTFGSNNLFAGANAGSNNTTGSSNIYLGESAGYNNTTGRYNVNIGTFSDYFNSGSNNVAIGYRAGGITMANDKSGNIFIGNESGYNELASNKLYIENSSSTMPLIYGEFDNDLIKINGDFAVATSGYFNFGFASGNEGYGLRDNGGNIEYKDDGGSWTALNALGGGSGTVNAGTAGYIAYYGANSSAVSATSSLYLKSDGTVGIGSVNPAAKLTVQRSLTEAGLLVRDSLGDTDLIVTADGKVGIGTSTPANWLHVYGSSRFDGTINLQDDEYIMNQDDTITLSQAALRLMPITASGTNNYTVSLDLTLYATGQLFMVTFTNANTGGAWLQVGSLATKRIVDGTGTQLSSGQITSGSTHLLMYDAASDSGNGAFVDLTK